MGREPNEAKTWRIFLKKCSAESDAMHEPNDGVGDG